MCGITGYIGKKEGLPIVLKCLHALEYRGYDSAGVVFFSDGQLKLLKAVGKLENLDKKVLGVKADSNKVAIGHCLHPNSIIQLSNGLTLFIKDLKDNEEVVNLNEDNLSLHSGKIKVFKHKSPPFLFKIKTPISSFIATGNHKTLVFRENKIIEKKIQELRVGDFLPFPRQLEIKNKCPIVFQNIFYKRYYSLTENGLAFLKNRLLGQRSLVLANTSVSSAYLSHIKAGDRNFREDKLKALYGYFGEDFNRAIKRDFLPVNTIHGKFISLPEISSPEAMQLIGYFIGDGHAGQRTVRFKDMNEGVLESYRKIIERVFNIKGRVCSMNDTLAKLLECNSYYLSQWLKKNIVKDKDTFISKIGALPNDQLAAFIRGLFDAEGCVALKSRQLGLAMINEFLVRSLQAWLLQFGIISSLSIEQPNKKFNRKNITYKLLVSNRESLEKFKQFINFSNLKKFNDLDQLIKSVGNKIFSFQFLKNYSDIAITRVKSIKKIKSDTESVYDLKVLDHENFIVNNIFTHNSRWATHGVPSEVNAHPHYDCQQKIFVVHNGIIENYRELKEKLEKLGHHFKSQTDTEVVAHLIEEALRLHPNKNFMKAFELALKQIRGAYAFAVVNKDEPEVLYIARLGSPLVVGINSISGQNEYFVASDPSALAGLAKKVIYLKDGQRGRLTLNNLEIGPTRPQRSENLELTAEQARKGNFPHFMLKEIFEIPEVVIAGLLGRLLPRKNIVKLGGLELIAKKLKAIKRLEILACGTSYYAGLVGELLFEELLNLPTEVTIASEFRYRKNPLKRNTAFLFISQSGETADTLAALRKANSKKSLTLGLVNVVGSAIARETKAGVYARAGAEIGVASTKAFLSQLTNLTLIALQLSPNKSLTQVKNIIKELDKIPEKIKLVLKNESTIKKLAKKYQAFNDFFYLGRGYNYPTALEGALKIKEIAYVHAEGYAGGEMKHGPLALIDKNFPTIALVTQNSLYEKMISNLEEVKARGGKILAIATKGDKNISKIADDVIYVPKTLEQLEPMINVIPLQLFAYHFGVQRGFDVDKPRNLAKSVTVE